MKRVGVVLVLLAVLVTPVLAKRDSGKGPGKGQGQGPRNDDPEMMMRQSFMNSAAARLAGVDLIMEKYNIKIQMIYLEARQKNLTLREKVHSSRVKLAELAVKEKKGETVDYKEVVVLVKEMIDQQAKLQDTMKEGMEQIKKLTDQREKEVRDALNKWVKKMENDPAEVRRFLQELNQVSPPPPMPPMMHMPQDE